MPNQRRAISVVSPPASSLRNRQPTTQPSPSRFFLRTILPAQGANVLRFVDFALSEIEPQNKADFTKALKALNERAKKTNPEATSFAGLNSAQQMETMKSMEKTDGFGMLRSYTIVGFLGDPADGGNKNKIGWHLIGFKDDFYYAPPFGYYDAQLMREQKEKA